MSASPVNNANGATGGSVNEARDPSGFLSEIIGAPVTVKLNSGVVYRGALKLSSRIGATSCTTRTSADKRLPQVNCNQSMDT